MSKLVKRCFGIAMQENTGLRLSSSQKRIVMEMKSAHNGGNSTILEPYVRFKLSLLFSLASYEDLD